VFQYTKCFTTASAHKFIKKITTQNLECKCSQHDANWKTVAIKPFRLTPTAVSSYDRLCTGPCFGRQAWVTRAICWRNAVRACNIRQSALCVLVSFVLDLSVSSHVLLHQNAFSIYTTMENDRTRTLTCRLGCLVADHVPRDSMIPNRQVQVQSIKNIPLVLLAVPYPV
jgi:hypothetical protein